MQAQKQPDTYLKMGDTVTYNNTTTVIERGERCSFGVQVVYLLGIKYPIPVNEVKRVQP